MTTDPTVAQILDKGLGKVLYDMRTPEGSRQALGGLYPSSSLYMNTDWVNSHQPTVQKLADAFVKTLGWMSTHTPEQIAAEDALRLRPGRRQALRRVHQGDAADVHHGRRDAGRRPQTVENVLKAFNPNLQHTTVDLSKTYTTQFVKKSGAN